MLGRKSVARLGLILLGTLASCGISKAGPPTYPYDPNLAFSERSMVPVYVPDGAGGVKRQVEVASLRLDNRHAKDVVITHIDLVADPGMVVTYAGWTDCHGGCVGTGDATDPLFHKSIRGTYPIRVPVEDSPGDRPMHLIFTVTADSAAESRLAKGVCLWLRALRVQFDDGTSATVTFTLSQRSPILGIEEGVLGNACGWPT